MPWHSREEFRIHELRSTPSSIAEQCLCRAPAVSDKYLDNFLHDCQRIKKKIGHLVPFQSTCIDQQPNLFLLQFPSGHRTIVHTMLFSACLFAGIYFKRLSSWYNDYIRGASCFDCKAIRIRFPWALTLLLFENGQNAESVVGDLTGRLFPNPDFAAF